MRRLWISLIIIGIMFGLVKSAGAIELEDCQNKPAEEKARCLTDLTAELESKIKEARGQQQTLASTIAYLDNKINLTRTEIERTENELKLLEEEITTLTVKISRLDIDLTSISKLLVTRIGAAYKRSLFNPVYMVFSHGGLSDFFERNKYLQAVQQNDRKLLLELQNSKDEHETQKLAKETKQQQAETLRQTLASQKTALGGQRVSKQELLDLTKNNEAKYQSLMAAAKAEQQAQALYLLFKDGKAYISYEVGNLVNHGTVGAESKIGTMGNSGYPGCSTGSHLHLEYFTEAKIENNKIEGVINNPINILQGKTVQWYKDNNEVVSVTLGGGGKNWPMNKPIITQMYGQTPYSSRYRYNFHTGLDLVDLDDYTVRAISGGTFYTGTLNCSAGSSLINVAIIDHGSGVFSTYMHLK